MSAPEVGLEETLSGVHAVQVRWDDRGPAHRLTRDGELTEVHRVSEHLDHLVGGEEFENRAAEWAWEQIADLKISKKARDEIAHALGVEVTS